MPRYKNDVERAIAQQEWEGMILTVFASTNNTTYAAAINTVEVRKGKLVFICSPMKKQVKGWDESRGTWEDAEGDINLLVPERNPDMIEVMIQNNNEYRLFPSPHSNANRFVHLIVIKPAGNIPDLS